MEVIKYPDKSIWKEILRRPEIDHNKLEKVVSDILDDVKSNGDKALLKYSVQFDKIKLDKILVDEAEIANAEVSITTAFKNAIALAKSNIEKFHNAQIISGEKIETTPGVKCWQKSIPIEKIGLYIPGGSAPLFSTVLMLGVPAVIAGCNEIILCSPPGKDGKIHPSILFTANFVGIKKIYKIGGAQAIGAMAYGTETVQQVFKIFGPGNQYVTAAKEIVNRRGIAIDMPAGPSEVAIIADKSSNPVFVAADLLSQAEHGIDSQVILFTTNEDIIEPVMNEVNLQLENLPRKAIADAALKHSKIVILNNENELMEIMNQYAPEHLIIATDNCERLAEKVINTGSVFLGHLTPVSAGDYASGTNHTLPTNGFAKIYSGVNLDSFIKKITFQEINENGIFNLGPTLETMSEFENLTGHKNSVSLRLKTIFKK